MARLPEYEIGELKRFTGTFLVGATPTDPTSPTFKMREPDGTLTTYVHPTNPEIVRDSAGVFHVDWPMEQAGEHSYRFSGTGAATDAAEVTFLVRRSRVLAN